MKFPVLLPPFTVFDSDPDYGESDDVAINNLWLIYTGNIPEGIGPDLLMPTTAKEVWEMAEQRGLSVSANGFNLSVYSIDFKNCSFPDQAYFCINHKGEVIAFEICPGSELNTITVEQLCEFNRYDYRELKRCTDKIIWERVNTL